jgi:hypothetical protein
LRRDASKGRLGALSHGVVHRQAAPGNVDRLANQRLGFARLTLYCRKFGE